MGGGKSTERDVQVAYWTDCTKNATLEAMLLDSRASEIDKLERPEVLKQLGSVEGKKVVELGAGIGRFTGELAKSASHVKAFDFMDNLCVENEKANGHLGNVEVACADAAKLELATDSCDVVFSNWLMMYLSDEEVERLAERALAWLVEGGLVFFRESCFRQSGDAKRTNNPSHYRDPNSYFHIFDKVSYTAEDGKHYRLELINARCIETYVKIKKNQNQICWKWKKVAKDPEVAEFRHFLDNCQYKRTGILRYERIFGEGYVSTGGVHTTEELLNKLTFKEGMSVLDVGCGIGGGDFYMAEKYGVKVLGADLSVNMFVLALERSLDRKCDVVFEVADVTKREYDQESFDIVYSRDTILHIDDKPALFKRLFGFLKPGGQLLITDYCRAPGTPSDHFAAYIKQRGYDLHSVEEYGKMLEASGFIDVEAEDYTHMFKSSLEREVSVAESNKEQFVSDFSEEDYNAVVNGWKEKLVRVGEGEQRWGLFVAKKPE